MKTDTAFSSMTAKNNIPVVSGKLHCPDGREVTPEICRFCLYSRSFIIHGKAEKSPALAFCLRERVTKMPDISSAERVICAADGGCGYTNIGNIIS